VSTIPQKSTGIILILPIKETFVHELVPDKKAFFSIPENSFSLQNN